MAITIPPNEHGQIRVFAINRPGADLSIALKQQGKDALIAELLGHPVAPGGAELFPVADLSSIGLSGYLAQGYAVPEGQLKDARTRLDALEGYVLLLFSAAFDGKGQTLTPGPDLTLIGTFGETQADMTPQVLESEAAQMQTISPEPDAPRAQANRPVGSILILALIALAGLALWLVLG